MAGSASRPDRHVLLFIVLASCVSTSIQAASTYVVDTGPGPPFFSEAASIASNQEIAGKFSLEHPYVITEVAGWLQQFDATYGGSAKARLYADLNGRPGELLFERDFALAPPNYAAGWLGPTDLSWEVGEGTYWAGFARETPPPFGEVDLSWPDGAAHALEEVAFRTSWGSWAWYLLDEKALGLRIGAVAVVPLPPAWLFLGTGVAFLVAKSHRSHSRR